MRHLHSRHDSRRDDAARAHPESNPGSDPRRPGRKSVPVHWVHANFRISRSRGARMRSHVPSYDLIAANDLQHALSMSSEGYRPIAGGTDVMVLFEAGKLDTYKVGEHSRRSRPTLHRNHSGPRHLRRIDHLHGHPPQQNSRCRISSSGAGRRANRRHRHPEPRNDRWKHRRTRRPRRTRLLRFSYMTPRSS